MLIFTINNKFRPFQTQFDKPLFLFSSWQFTRFNSIPTLTMPRISLTYRWTRIIWIIIIKTTSKPISLLSISTCILTNIVLFISYSFFALLLFYILLYLYNCFVNHNIWLKFFFGNFFFFYFWRLYVCDWLCRR